MRSAPGDITSLERKQIRVATDNVVAQQTQQSMPCITGGALFTG